MNGQRAATTAKEDSGVTTVQATASDDEPRRAAASKPMPAPGVSNKPMVPTAPSSPTVNPLHPLRRHIGQPFGSRKTAIGLRSESVGETRFGRRAAQMVVIR
ncbi:MAG: hypothetical protein EPO40_33160 [Myxococcaceae bacterium]|nr:MAG: hypothetical protein EPO40_33160 [Myxococcaceae bacterium]